MTTNLDSWTLQIAHLDSDTYTTLASGNAPFTAANLYTLDPSQLPNGFYKLLLTATNISGQTATAQAEIRRSIRRTN